MKGSRKNLYKLTGFVLLVAFHLLSGRVAFYELLHALNRQALESTVCVRRTPDCHARCYLKKQIDATERQEENAAPAQPKPSRLHEETERELFLPTRLGWAVTLVRLTFLSPYELSIATEDFHPEVFRPPEILPERVGAESLPRPWHLGWWSGKGFPSYTDRP